MCTVYADTFPLCHSTACFWFRTDLDMSKSTVCPFSQTLLSRFWFEVHPEMGSAEEVEAESHLVLVLQPGRPMKMTLTPHSA
jgi:hypothetical protein